MGSYYIQMSGDYLEHHGIEGQKWGVRNGPPYPLDAGDRSPREVRAALRKKNRGEDKDAKAFSKELSAQKMRMLAKNRTVESYDKALNEAVSGLKKMFPNEFETYKNTYGLSDDKAEQLIKKAVAKRSHGRETGKDVALWAAFGVISIPIMVGLGDFDKKAVYQDLKRDVKSERKEEKKAYGV